jgi:capsid portal protein
MITANTLRAATAYVDWCAQHATIHTVTITLNGSHGGADVIIEGEVADTESVNEVSDYIRTYEVAL